MTVTHTTHITIETPLLHIQEREYETQASNTVTVLR